MKACALIVVLLAGGNAAAITSAVAVLLVVVGVLLSGVACTTIVGIVRLTGALGRQHQTRPPSPNGAIMTVTITSFGYGHAPAPEADLTVDARRLLHDPHVDPAMREMTGLDETVRRHVLATRGAKAWVEHETAAVRALLVHVGRPVTVAFGCAGGRHRSVVMASECARLLSAVGFDVVVEHRDVTKPVIRR